MLLLLLLPLLRIRDKEGGGGGRGIGKLFYVLFEKRLVALHDGIKEKIHSLPRNAWGVIIV
jgi:hypothetical protein